MGAGTSGQLAARAAVEGVTLLGPWAIQDRGGGWGERMRARYRLFCGAAVRGQALDAVEREWAACRRFAIEGACSLQRSSCGHCPVDELARLGS